MFERILRESGIAPLARSGSYTYKLGDADIHIEGQAGCGLNVRFVPRDVEKFINLLLSEGYKYVYLGEGKSLFKKPGYNDILIDGITDISKMTSKREVSDLED